MIKHIVMFTFKESAKGMDRKSIAEMVKAELESLPPQIPEVKAYEVGLNFNSSASAYDLVIYSEFDDKEGLNAYQVHPAHEKSKEFIGPLRDKMAVVDYEVPGPF